MAKTKFYAVRKGYVPGVYLSWDEAKNQVDRYRGAEYKSFDNYESAAAWIENRDLAALEVELLLNEGFTVVYTDGSANDSACSYAALIISPDGKETVLSGKEVNPDFLATRNVAGELSAVVNALRFCKSHDLSEIVVFHDYEGCAKWATGDWKANSVVSQNYVSFISSCGLKVSFRKVSGHSGNSYNERVDKLARAALD